jgi:hypothetical protein
MMVFGKQNSADVIERPNSMSTRTFHLSMNERKADDSSTITQDNSSSVASKLLPIQPDNMSLTIAARYDAASLNRPQTMVRIKCIYIINKICFFFRRGHPV